MQLFCLSSLDLQPEVTSENLNQGDDKRKKKSNLMTVQLAKIDYVMHL